MRRHERDAHRLARQHHDRARDAAGRGQIFGVSAERDARIVDHALLHGRGDHGGELTAATPVDRAIQQREHVARIAGIESTRDDGPRNGMMLDDEPSGGFGDGDAQRTGAFVEQRAIDEADDLAAEVFAQGELRERDAEVRADAGGLAGGQRDACPQLMISTNASSRSRRSHSSVSSSALLSRSCA